LPIYRLYAKKVKDWLLIQIKKSKKDDFHKLIDIKDYFFV